MAKRIAKVVGGNSRHRLWTLGLFSLLISKLDCFMPPNSTVHKLGSILKLCAKIILSYFVIHAYRYYICLSDMH